MFTKNLKDQFSADLLNTVRGILGEAKHNKECECEKCEKEEDDEDEDEKEKMKEGYVSHAQRKAVWANRADDGAGHPDKKKKMKKEGYVPTADEPTEADKKTAQKVRDMLAKEKKPKKPVKEAAEQIVELSKKTLGSYVNKAAERMSTQGVTAGLKIAADEKSKKNFDNIAKRQKGIARAVSKLTKEEQEFIDALNNGMFEELEVQESKILDAHFGKQTLKVQNRLNNLLRRGHTYPEAVKKVPGATPLSMKENVDLEEGRGRPPKEGSAAWHAKQKQANDDMPALGVQLRKAKSMNKKVRFMNGKEHDIHPNHVDRFEDHMAARRTTQEKDAFQKQAHKSHADFVKAVSAPVPKAAKDTGEIVKYRH